MDSPAVKNTIVDEARNVTYHIMAYRELTREEMTQCVRSYLSQRKRKKKFEHDAEITIVTVFGATPGS